MIASGNKHENRSAQTRERFIKAAQQLYAQRSIDSVSLNEITVAAGQKNRNALQYHFGNRSGLLQAIIDRHSSAVFELRKPYLEQARSDDWTAGEAAARALLMPLADYIEQNSEGIHYVRILSQLSATNSDVIDPTSASALSFRSDDTLENLFGEALSHLSRREVQRRMFIVVSLTFHTLADICRASEGAGSESLFQDRVPMYEQLVIGVRGLLEAPARE